MVRYQASITLTISGLLRKGMREPMHVHCIENTCVCMMSQTMSERKGSGALCGRVLLSANFELLPNSESLIHVMQHTFEQWISGINILSIA